ncbi:hypothetical protein [Umezawaea beigongshangensis]|uniref:hypothetical protein n=1 Tax=Umezawaea beigongshangensis TaxID=2780383 RepID=UPI0018F23A74|nr:hypothetical protein [Umezawaea beigongshangensis]
MVAASAAPSDQPVLQALRGGGDSGGVLSDSSFLLRADQRLARPFPEAWPSRSPRSSSAARPWLTATGGRWIARGGHLVVSAGIAAIGRALQVVLGRADHALPGA